MCNYEHINVIPRIIQEQILMIKIFLQILQTYPYIPIAYIYMMQQLPIFNFPFALLAKHYPRQYLINLH